LSGALTGWLRSVAQREREASMSLFNVHSDATARIGDALIAAEAMRTITLLMSELHKASCCEETYSSAGLSSIARESFGVRLWLRRINLGLEKGEKGLSHRSWQSGR
jgi:hypothetical protein